MVVTYAVYLLAAWGAVSLLGMIYQCIDRRLEQREQNMRIQERLDTYARIYDGNGDN